MKKIEWIKEILENSEKVYELNLKLKELIESEDYKQFSVYQRTLIRMLLNYTDSFIRALEELKK